MFDKIEYNKVIFNDLSDELRALLEEKVPYKEGAVMSFRRTANPYIAAVIDGEGETRGKIPFPMAKLGGRRVRSRSDISDPFNKKFVKVVNLFNRDENGAPIDSNVIFPRDVSVIEIPLDTFHGRQSAAMFFLIPEFRQNILGEKGAPLKADVYDYELLDKEGIAEKRAKQIFTASELNMKLSALTLPKLRLLARYTGYPNADVDTGRSYMDVWIQGKIDSSSIGQVQDGFEMLDVLEIEDLLITAYKRNLIYKDDAVKMIRFGNDAPIIAYDINTDNQFRHAAKWLVQDEKNAKEMLSKITMLVEKTHEKIEQQIIQAIQDPPLPDLSAEQSIKKHTGRTPEQMAEIRARRKVEQRPQEGESEEEEEE